MHNFESIPRTLSLLILNILTKTAHHTHPSLIHCNIQYVSRNIVPVIQEVVYGSLASNRLHSLRSYLIYMNITQRPHFGGIGSCHLLSHYNDIVDIIL